jgi:hypothetical protein
MMEALNGENSKGGAYHPARVMMFGGRAIDYEQS